MAGNRRDFLRTSSLVAVPLLLHPGVRADQPKPPKNRFLEGNFAPLRVEFTEDQLKVVGQIPKELDGLFVRNGPNPQFDPVGAYHWFEGDGMLHGVRLRDGQASYRNRFIRTTGYEAEKKAGKPVFSSVLEMPDMKKVLAGQNPFKNAANTHIICHAGKAYALYEAGEPHQIRLPELETIGPELFGGKLKHPVAAHPKTDPTSGELLGFGYVPTKPLALFTTWNAQGEFVSTRPVTLPWPAMIHDFVITKRFAVFPVAPKTFDMKRAFTGNSPWYFDETKPMKIGLVPRDDKGEPKWFEAKTCFVFHFLNAYEQGQEVILTGCRYPRFPGVISFDPKADQQKPNASQLYQWKLNLETGQVTEGPLNDLPSEFPRLNDRFTAQAHRYGYFGVEDDDFFQSVAKIDLKTGQVMQHPHGAGRHGGEAVFVAKPGAEREDDGWLLNWVYDKAANKSEMVIIAAGDVTAKPVARVMLPTRVPYGFHGSWVWSKEFTKG